MPSKEVREWLSEFKSLKKEEFNTYAATIRQREELGNALITLFDGDLTNEFVEPVCHQLFIFFKSGHIELRRFTLDLLPTLVYTYLAAVARGEKRKCSGLEACLLGIYNLEVVTKDGKPKVQTLTIPTLAVASIYHEPPSLATLALTESSLLRYHTDEPVAITVGPLPQIENINAQNRMTVLKYVMSVYNADIKNLQSKSHYTLCKVCTRLAKQGFDHIEDIGVTMVTIDLNDSMSSTSSRSSRKSVKFNSANDSRIPLDAELMIELLSALYFTMFNGQAHPSIEALNFLHKRACYERFSDVLLVTNSIRNSLQFNPSGQPQDGPMGISVALTPYQRDEKHLRHAITNASFRGKRLPEDIEVIKGENQSDNPPHYDDIESDVSSMKDSTISDSKVKASGTSKLQQLSQPLKSIIKKGSDKYSEKPDKAKVHRKESDSQRQKSDRSDRDRDSISDTNSPRSPKHSMSPISNGASYNNGDVTDLDSINVQVADGNTGKRSTVDHFEMASISSQSSSNYDKRNDTSTSGHVPEKGFAAHLKEKLTKSHSKEQRLTSSVGSDTSSKESLNTHL